MVLCLQLADTCFFGRRAKQTTKKAETGNLKRNVGHEDGLDEGPGPVVHIEMNQEEETSETSHLGLSSYRPRPPPHNWTGSNRLH